jgi:hypothetical protein
VSVNGRFLLGAVLPALALAAVVGLLIATGGGLREAPMIVFFAALFAVPAVVLLNCWVLFVSWPRRTPLVGSGLLLPAIFALGSALFIHGSGRWQEIGMLPLVPFMMAPTRGLGILAVVWALAVVALLLVAQRLAGGKQAP